MGYANKPEQAVVGMETSKLQLKAVLLRDGELLCKVLENDMAGYRWLRSWLQKNDVAVPACACACAWTRRTAISRRAAWR